MKKLDQENLTALALETAAYIQWVEVRSEYSASNEMIDHYTRGLLEREGYAVTPDSMQAIAILASSLNPDTVYEFINSSGLFADFDRASRKSNKNIL